MTHIADEGYPTGMRRFRIALQSIRSGGLRNSMKEGALFHPRYPKPPKWAVIRVSHHEEKDAVFCPTLYGRYVMLVRAIRRKIGIQTWRMGQAYCIFCNAYTCDTPGADHSGWWVLCFPNKAKTDSLEAVVCPPCRQDVERENRTLRAIESRQEKR